jgi:hypothetical protein
MGEPGGPTQGGVRRAAGGSGVEVSAIRPSITGDDLRRPGRQDD